MNFWRIESLPSSNIYFVYNLILFLVEVFLTNVITSEWDFYFIFLNAPHPQMYNWQVLIQETIGYVSNSFSR